MSQDTSITEDKQAPQTDKVHRNMTVGEIVEQYPQVAEIFMEYGLHCVGCHVAHWETIEEGARGHGMDEETIDMMIRDANTIATKVIEETAKQVNHPIKITTAAINHVKDMLTKQNKEDHLFKIQVLEGGCSGYSYDFSLQKEAKDNDTVFEQDGLVIAVDKESQIQLNGCTVDYVDTFSQSGFKIHNPNAETTCGCGSSFA